MVDWDYNAWGGKYPPFDLDDVVPTRVAEMLGLPVFYPRMILEGGSIEVNGAGALLTTEELSAQSESQSRSSSREQIEERLRDYLGVREILWLGDGIEGDDTDGHIDDLTRFVGERTVVTVVEEDRSRSEPRAAAGRTSNDCAAMTIGGKPLEIVTLPMPARIDARRSASASQLREFLHREQVRSPADLRRSERRGRDATCCKVSSRRVASSRSIAAS